MRVRVLVQGIVQGVGFRPFVYGLANRLALVGFVRNDPGGVTIEVEGAPATIDTFLQDLVETAPPLARIERVSSEFAVPLGEPAFSIVASEATGSGWLALVSPDVATCDDCLAEIRDPAARRYGYPFTNCTNCGPRFTITTDIPYDRPNTTMAGFPMCEACRAEYEDPADRRFHAQPIACPACGPAVHLAGVAPGEVVGACADLLRGGSIVALKGLGGYHLVCDARNEKAVGELRARKVREDKPFALMASGIDVVRELCEVSEHEAALLSGYRRPVVLLRRRSGAERAVAPSVAPGNRFLGFMLPYTPLHHLLLDAFGPHGVLVMTSGNHSDEPIAYVDGDARQRLDPIADVFVAHDRPIHVRCDDSVTRSFRGEEYLMRRSRGYAPEPLLVTEAFGAPVLATGAELKHTFCLGSGTRAFLSHHIGDLENWETMRSFIEGVAHFCNVFQIHPEVIAHDLHPEYLATKWAVDQAAGDAPAPPGIDLEGCRLIGVQHHHAHIAACLADNQVAGPVIGLALDGTGWGTDGTIWGGEVLVADLAGFRRAGHLRQVALPGGAAAIREPWRMGANYLREAFGAGAAELPLPFVRDTTARWGPVLEMAVKGVNAPLTSSAGRLFDAAAAVAGLRGTVNYEGQAAIELEQAADPSESSAYPCPVGDAGGVLVIDSVALIRALAEDLVAEASLPVAAARFHNGLAAALVETCSRVRDATGLAEVALSGGTFQNLLLLERVMCGLESEGFSAYRHRRVPANDGGISLGQAMVAGAVLRRS
ncbi:MAG: carbamoyltransferase HypF [Actinobacteria bacterium]|nr:carbamoyltransferase HypF [Actinomycetota bacterium]